ncbi:hypothetical protein BDV09DRAFT_169391 [Aspergillus tetrazonus]
MRVHGSFQPQRVQIQFKVWTLVDFKGIEIPGAGRRSRPVLSAWIRSECSSLVARA